MAARRRYYDDFPHFSQPSVALLRRNAEESVAKAQKKGKVYDPVIPKGNSRTICVSWWGQSWCRNMERYADYASRLSRGKTYVRQGTVLDLKIQQGVVLAKVQGSRRTPYSVEIHIDPLPEDRQKALMEQCSKKITAMEDLIYGQFPEELKELFLERDGLFPAPKEIHMGCSCPDWAVMCKHVAAVMYGIGVRLDDNPFYFFSLRGIDADGFVTKALEDRVNTMLEHATSTTDRMIPDSDIASIFGIV